MLSPFGNETAEDEPSQGGGDGYGQNKPEPAGGCDNGEQVVGIHQHDFDD
ncbi:MAG: hypothetical protein UW64_C0010G0003 [Microgenomates group bacterium GW2011_GWC1_44_37]|nr:MAG: hypothetical protein UW56_C0019G0003 [Candidatus Collierbacteria bacterium GW2011_GWD1_44_27]KKT68764.1 MAG: hypothetical protein UW64_C0010G0003 [Microgenomates group bacterium GW2011_GWC1_44_37]